VLTVLHGLDLSQSPGSVSLYSPVIRLPASSCRYWSMAGYQDRETPAEQVTAGRDADVAGGDAQVDSVLPVGLGDGPSANLGAAAGLQVGSGNVQVNHFYGYPTGDPTKAKADGQGPAAGDQSNASDESRGLGRRGLHRADSPAFGTAFGGLRGWRHPRGH